MRLFGQRRSPLAAAGLRIVGINVDDPRDARTVQTFVAREGFLFPTLIATRDVAGVYNIVYRYLSDRSRDLGLPTPAPLNLEG